MLLPLLQIGPYTIGLSYRTLAVLCLVGLACALPMVLYGYAVVVFAYGWFRAVRWLVVR